MIPKEEIQHISKLMKIETDNYTEYVDKVQDIIKYFNILDSAGVESEEIILTEIPIANLRKDVHVTFNDKLIKKINNYKNNYVRAPKMS